jgi:hypothetical protein
MTPLELCVQAIVDEGAPKPDLSGVPWDQRWPLLEEHGITSLLYPLVRDIPGVPDDLRARFRRASEDASVHCALAVQALLNLRDEVTKTGRIVILKGLALNDLIYAEPFIRSMSDVDLLLPDGNLAAVQTALAQAGFIQYREYPSNWRNGLLCFDLHEDLRDASRIPARIATATDLDIQASVRVPGYWVLSPRLLMEHIAFHAIKHNLSQAKWWVDLLLCDKKMARESNGEGPSNFSYAGAALGYLQERGFKTASRLQKPKGIRKRALYYVFGHGDQPGMGELALALSGPTWQSTIAYIQASLLPREKILKEMYGQWPYVVLVLIRIGVLAGYAFRFIARAIFRQK